MQSLPLGVAEIGYSMVVKALGLESLSTADQIKELVRIPYDEFEAKTRDVHAPTMSWIDDDVVRSVATYSSIASPDGLKKDFPGVSWCPTIWMGSCELDGAIFLITALAGRTDDIAAALSRCISTTLAGHQDIVPSLISLYGLSSASTPEAQAQAVADFGTDTVFAQAAKALAQAWYGTTGTSLLSTFTVPNPWVGGWKGHATHGLDAAFALLNYNEFLGDGQKACAEKMGRDLVDFVTGADKLPWVGSNGGREVLYHAEVEGQDESRVISSEEAAKGHRREELERIVAGRPEVLDRLMDAVGMFLSGQ